MQFLSRNLHLTLYWHPLAKKLQRRKKPKKPNYGLRKSAIWTGRFECLFNEFLIRSSYYYKKIYLQYISSAIFIKNYNDNICINNGESKSNL